MFKYFFNKNIDLALWDDCINNSVNGKVFALSWYLNEVCEKWDALIEVEGDCYAKVLPIPIKKKMGIKHIFQPNFVPQLGLFYRNDSVTSSDFKEIENILKSTFRYIDRYSFNIENTKYLEPIASKLYKKEITLYIDLHKTPEEIINNFSKSRRKNIRRGLKVGYQIHKSNSILSLIELFKKNTENRIYGGVNASQYRVLERVFLQSTERKLGNLIVLIDNNQKTISATFFLIYKNIITNLFSASSTEGRSCSAESLLIAEICKLYAQNELWLDMEGIGTEGIYGFKKRFNPLEKTYFVFSYNNLPQPVRLLRYLRRMFILICRKNKK